MEEANTFEENKSVNFDNQQEHLTSTFNTVNTEDNASHKEQMQPVLDEIQQLPTKSDKSDKSVLNVKSKLFKMKQESLKKDSSVLQEPMIGYKTAGGCLVVLQIHKGARTNLTRDGVLHKKTAKFRCDRATPIAIMDWKTGEYYAKVQSDRIYTFTYKLNRESSEPSFDTNLHRVCTTGIHFFLTKIGAYSWNCSDNHLNDGTVNFSDYCSHKKSKKKLKKRMKKLWKSYV